MNKKTFLETLDNSFYSFEENLENPHKLIDKHALEAVISLEIEGEVTVDKLKDAVYLSKSQLQIAEKILTFNPFI